VRQKKKTSTADENKELDEQRAGGRKFLVGEEAVPADWRKEIPV